MNNFLEARRFFTYKIKSLNNEVVQIYGYIKVVNDLIRRIYESEPDCESRKAKIDFFQRCRRERELMGLVALQKIVEYQNLLLDLYENNFILGKKYYFF